VENVQRLVMEGQGDEKTVWPELVGQPKLEAKALLDRTTSKQVFLVKLGDMMTMDYRLDRIRIMFDPATDLVAVPPRVG
jgi:hypothetical protein